MDTAGLKTSDVLGTFVKEILLPQTPMNPKELPTGRISVKP